MAIDYNSEYFKSLNRLHLIYLKVLVRCGPIIDRWRKALRRILPAPVSAPVPFPALPISPRLEAHREIFRKQGWAFVEGIFSTEAHQQLLAQWPRSRYLTAPRMIEKSFNLAFRWNIREGKGPVDLEKFPAIKLFFDYVRSEECSRRIADFIDSPEPLICDTFVLTTTVPGSIVAPHRDSISTYADAKPSTNVVFFIDGTGGENSGGLCILKDNTYHEIIFEAQQLKNTCLLYDTFAPLFHGYKPVRLGKFRHTILAHFCRKQFIEKTLGRPL